MGRDEPGAEMDLTEGAATISIHVLIQASVRLERVSAMDVNLIAVSPKGNQKTIPLQKDVVIVGRQPNCTLRVPLSEISRQHCQLRLTGNKVILRDLDSVNGTFVNSRKIKEEELKPGDVISLGGGLKFYVQINGQPAQIGDGKPRTAKAVGETKRTANLGSSAPAEISSATRAGKTDVDEADAILGESFFLDMEEDEKE